MELKYPINLMDIETHAPSGYVLTPDGEFLGTWVLTKDPPIKGYPDGEQGGSLGFIPDGKDSELFSESIGILDSGTLFGLAMSELCSKIREWHEYGRIG